MLFQINLYRYTEEKLAEASLAAEKVKLEQIVEGVKRREAELHKKRVKKSIWHFTVSLKRRALLGGAVQVESSWTRSLKAPDFNACAYKVISWFKN